MIINNMILFFSHPLPALCSPNRWDSLRCLHDRTNHQLDESPLLLIHQTWQHGGQTGWQDTRQRGSNMTWRKYQSCFWFYALTQKSVSVASCGDERTKWWSAWLIIKSDISWLLVSLLVCFDGWLISVTNSPEDTYWAFLGFILLLTSVLQQERCHGLPVSQLRSCHFPQTVHEISCMLVKLEEKGS